MPSETKLLALLQPTIKVDVQYLNDAHKAALMQYAKATEIEALVKNGIEIPMPEFLTHYLFFRRRPGKEGWRNYQQLGQRIGVVLSYLDDWVDFNGTSISLSNDIEGLERGMIEHIGESIGLSAINFIHGLTEADWDVIPTKPGPKGRKTLDFQVASDGANVVQLETKGAATSRNGGVPSFTSKIDHIAQKKADSIAYEQTASNVYSVDARYGTIALLTQDANRPVKCFLLDPPSVGGTDAQRLKLIQRLRFIRDWVTFLSARSQLAAALTTRVAAIETMDNPFELEGVELLRGNGQSFAIASRGNSFGYNISRSSFFAMKSYVIDGPDGGVVIPLKDGNLFFLGIRTSILQLAADQNLESLMNNIESTGSVQKTISCIVNKNTEWGAAVLERLGRNSDKASNHVRFMASGIIHYSPSGVLFGVLPISVTE